MHSTSNEAISVHDLCKIYPNDFVALDHLTFSIRKGEIFGFLGLNGAGKTTTIKILTTLIPHTSGQVKVLGFDVKKGALDIRKRIGVVQQKESYDRNLTVIASLRTYAALWGIRDKEATSRIDSVLKRFSIEELKDRKIRWLSFGQRRRLQVAREFIHDSELLILDEPTVGLDVLVRHAFLDFCKQIAKGKDRQTIFFTTHIVSEAEDLCDRIALIHEGRIIALDSPRELKTKYGGLKSVSVVLRNASDVPKVRNLADGLREIQAVEALQDTSEVRLVSHDPFRLASEFSSILETNGYDAESIMINEPSLEDVVLKLLKEREAAV